MSWGVLFNTVAAQLGHVLPSADFQWVQHQVAAWYRGAWLQVGRGGTDPTFKVEFGRGVPQGSVVARCYGTSTSIRRIQLEEYLQALAGADLPLTSQRYVDDLCVMARCKKPADVLDSLWRAVDWLEAQFKNINLDVNYGTGKTEIMAKLRSLMEALTTRTLRLSTWPLRTGCSNVQAPRIGLDVPPRAGASSKLALQLRSA